MTVFFLMFFFQTDKNHRIAIEIESLTELHCYKDYACFHWLEIKYTDDWANTGPRYGIISCLVFVYYIIIIINKFFLFQTRFYVVYMRITRNIIHIHSLFCRFCCGHTPSKAIISTRNKVLVIFRANYTTPGEMPKHRGVALRYYAGKCLLDIYIYMLCCLLL